MAGWLRSLNLVLLGSTGAGKSASGNTILGRQAFKSKESFTSVTQDLAVKSGAVCGRRVTVYDTPGLTDRSMSDYEILHMINEEVLQKCESGPCVFLLVIKADRFTEREKCIVEMIEKLLGKDHMKKTWILFTGRDELEEENTTIDEFINGTKALKNLVEKYDQRYHLFNNKKKVPNGQVQELLSKIDPIDKGAKPKQKLVKGQVTPAYGSDTSLLNTDKSWLSRRGLLGLDGPFESDTSRRIVLLGKTGDGKSAAGNTILGQKEFDSIMNTSSVTRECSEAHATVSGRSVSVVDTPGLYHTEMNPEELMMEISRSVFFSSPGPHAFLIVFTLSMRFTEHELQILEQIKTLFGQEVLKYSIILFTHGDQLYGESVEKLIKQNCKLRDLVDQCGDRFHILNNKDQNNREQVNDLLQKIDTMIEQNGGGHYSTEMFEIQRFRQEEEKRQRQERQRQEEIERVRKETEEKIRAEYEGPPSFLLESLKELRPRAKRDNELLNHWGNISPFERYRIVMKREEEIKTVVNETMKTVRADLSQFESRVREEEKRKQEEKQRQEEIERERKETEEKIRAELEGPPSFLLERLKAMRLREEDETKREEKRRQKEIERVRKEIEERIRAEYEGLPSFLLESLKELRLRKEEKIRREVEKQKISQIPSFLTWYPFELYKSFGFMEQLMEFGTIQSEMEKKIKAEIERQ